MKFGLTMFPTDYSIGPGDLAAAIEERSFESFWVPEHSHFPVSPMTPGPGEPGLPRMYYDVVDPFVALAMAAQATERLLLGTSICLVVQRDPIQLAKQVASLDALSGGRFLFGVGGGWNALEMADHGTAFDERLAIMDERLEAMKAILPMEFSLRLPEPVEIPTSSFPAALNSDMALQSSLFLDSKSTFLSELIVVLLPESTFMVSAM